MNCCDKYGLITCVVKIDKKDTGYFLTSRDESTCIQISLTIQTANKIKFDQSATDIKNGIFAI